MHMRECSTSANVAVVRHTISSIIISVMQTILRYHETVFNVLLTMEVFKREAF